MTAAALQRRYLEDRSLTTGPYAQGWTVSVLFHGLVIVGVILLLSDLKLVPQAEPFKWDVAMVHQATPPSPAPTPERIEPRPVQPETLRQTVRQPERRPVESRPIVQPVQRIQPVQRVVHQEVREVRPIVQAAPEPQRTVAEQTSVPVVNETVTIPKHEAVINPVVQETTVAEPPPAATTPEPVTSEAPPLAAGEASSVPDAPIVSRTAPLERHPAVRDRERHAAVQEMPVQARPATRPDYSWLAETLWSRVERIKRYPYLARMNRWEGKVVLEAVIREDGHVLNLKVAQSSGYAVLDKDAMEVVQKASPLSLKHPLGQPQVIVQVPISYRLER